MLSSQNSEISTNAFLNILTTTVQESTDTILITNKQTKLKPWITSGIVTAMVKRDKIKEKLIKDKNNITLKNTYKYYRNKINSLIKNAKNNYYQQQLDIHEADPKNTWKTIHEINNKTKNNQNSISHIKVQDKVITDDLEKSELFNSFFINIGQTIASKIVGNNNEYECTYILEHIHIFNVFTPS